MIIETEKSQTPPQSRFRRVLRKVGRHSVGFLVILIVISFLLIFLIPDIFVTIRSGQAGVVYLRFFGGTQTDHVLAEGLQVIPPWDHIFVYNVRVQEHRHKMTVLTKEGLSVDLHISVRYHPEIETLGILHQRVGPTYRDKIVVPEVEDALRTIMGEFTMPQVYGSDRGLIQKVIGESLEHVSQKYVRVDSVVLRSVELPEKLKSAVEEKMREQELSEAYQFKLEREKKEAERRSIEAEGLKKYNDVLNSSLTVNLLKWRAIEATRELANSPNTKTIVVGNTSNGLPIMLGGDK